MNVNSRMRAQLLVQNGVFVILLVGLAFALIWATKDVKTQWDVTQSQRNTLSQASIDVLKQLKGPIKVTAFTAPQDPEPDIRKIVENFLGRYSREKKDIQVTYIDLREQLQKAQAAGIRANGELVVEYNGRSEHLTILTEQELTNLLQRLARSAERPVAYLDGHGERKLDGRANHDLGDFGAQLNVKGFKSEPLNLGVAPEVPQNLAVLVIASPRVDPLPGEVAKVRRWIEKGGNLFWLIDSESLHGLQGLADDLGLSLTPGVVVDPGAIGNGLPATFAQASAYGRHRITDLFTIKTVFPYARRIAPVEGGKWTFTPLVEVAQQGWLETGGIDKNVSFDPKKDVKGPIVVAAALERSVGDRKQRVVVAGSGHFLANESAGLLGNMDLGINMLNWLAGDESLITVQARPRVDSVLDLSLWARVFVLFGFLIALPLALLVAGVVVWWRRRRA